MQYDIQSAGFPLTEAMAAHVRRRLCFALARHADRITQVAVRLGEIHGPRGDIDKFCRIQMKLLDAATVQITDSGPRLDAVIDRASDRSQHAVATRLERARFGQPLATPARTSALGRMTNWQIAAGGADQRAG